MKFIFALIALLTTTSLAAPTSLKRPSEGVCWLCGLKYWECMDYYVDSYSEALGKPTDIPQFYQSQWKCVELMEEHYRA
ncbi:hypothetical protein J4E91_008773 [Alternaria rosae]|nr:hypothetical protein J4E91_008773 [Alternaria rosae]